MDKKEKREKDIKDSDYLLHKYPLLEQFKKKSGQHKTLKKIKKSEEKDEILKIITDDNDKIIYKNYANIKVVDSDDSDEKIEDSDEKVEDSDDSDEKVEDSDEIDGMDKDCENKLLDDMLKYYSIKTYRQEYNITYYYKKNDNTNENYVKELMDNNVIIDKTLLNFNKSDIFTPDNITENTLNNCKIIYKFLLIRIVFILF